MLGKKELFSSLMYMMYKVKTQKYWTLRKIQKGKSQIKWQNQKDKTHQTNE